MTRQHAPEVRITGDPRAKAQAAGMVGGHELRLFTYMQPYDLRQGEQYAALCALYRKDFDRECPAPPGGGDAPVRYLFVVDGEPVLMPEAQVPGAVFFAALIKQGWGAALKVLHDDEILS
jgi:hypothetical protein